MTFNNPQSNIINMRIFSNATFFIISISNTLKVFLGQWTVIEAVLWRRIQKEINNYNRVSDVTLVTSISECA